MGSWLDTTKDLTVATMPDTESTFKFLLRFSFVARISSIMLHYLRAKHFVKQVVGRKSVNYQV